MSRDIWFSDTEVYAHDWLFAAKRQSDGETFAVWNDPERVQEFIEAYRPVLCGFNYRDYDQWILKGILLGWAPEDIHHVSQTIVTQDDRSMVWALFNGHRWVNVPPIIDLYHDITPRKSLKELEAMMGLPIVESSVSFDIDRPLTDAERDEVTRYCLSDVDATEQLYDLRINYLSSKTTLCEMRGIDPLDMLKHTNARIVSEVLGASKMAKHPEERYEVPDNLDTTAIPAEVLAYALSWDTRNCTMQQPPTVDFMFHDCPTTVGLGGIHAAVPKYRETASDERAILLQDIGSYYPSLIINNGYMSRAVADPSLYEQFYRMRMDAKAAGDKATADAAKLVLNTTYGATKDIYNKLYDPMQATRVCLSGQLYILDLIEQMFRAVPEGLQLIQLNTDGWVVSCRRADLTAIEGAVAAWSERTQFTVDTTEVEKIVQRDVNNYVLRKTDGKVKAKGGTVACYAGPDLFYQMPQIIRNNNTIIDKAVTDYLLDGVPIAETVNACDDLERFQIVVKAGRTFQKVVHVTNSAVTGEPISEYEIQRCNRVYATTAKTCGGIFKVKMEDGVEVSRTKVPLTPDHCFIDNENTWKNRPIELTNLDRGWYIELARKKAREFITRTKKEKEQMAEVNEEHNELQTAPETKKATPKPRSRKKTAPAEETAAIPPFKVRLLELQKLMAGASTGVKFDGVVENISYEYADTQQYKKWLSQACSALDLIFKLDIEATFPQVIGKSKGGGDIYGSQADGKVTIMDVHSDAFETYAITGFGSNVQPGYVNGGAQTNALRNFLLNGFLLDNKGREGDDQAFNAVAESAGQAAAATVTTKSGYVSDSGKTAIRQGIAEDKAEEKQYATDLFAKALYEKVIEAQKYQPEFGAKMLAEHFEADGTPKLGENGKSTMLKDTAVKGLTKAEEIIATAEKAA